MEVDKQDFANTDSVEHAILEYARFHGLCVNYELEQLLSKESISLPFTFDVQIDLHNSIRSDDDYFLSDITKERLTITKDSALLLRSICVTSESDELDTFLSTNRKSRKLLKQELPVLQSDNQFDLLNFGSTAIPDSARLNIPFAIVDAEKDESLEWPSTFFDYPKRYDQYLREERLAIPREHLLYLQTAVKDAFDRDDYEAMKLVGLQYRRNPAPQPLTPPLLPISPELTPYIPSSPGNHIELLSERTDSTAAELKDLEDRLMRDDALVSAADPKGLLAGDSILPAMIEESIWSSPLGNVTDHSVSSKRKRKVEDLKVEGPLTPPMSLQSPEKRLKWVSFPEMLHEYIPDLPSNFESGNDILGSQDSFNAFFNEEIAPLAQQAKRRVEMEQLIEVDTTKRAEVPVIDFSLPQPPWLKFARASHLTDETELASQTKILLWLKRDEFKNMSSWHGVTRLERELPWSPFSSELGKVALNEQLEYDGLLEESVKDFHADNVPDSASLTWKPDGLRLLDDVNDSDDELEPADFDEKADMRSLLRKRKVELEEEDRIAETARELDLMISADPSKRTADPSKRTADPSKQISQTVRPHGCSSIEMKLGRPAAVPPLPKSGLVVDSGLMFGGIFSASNALHKFMELRGRTTGANGNAEKGIEHSGHSPKPELPPLILTKIPPAETPEPIRHTGTASTVQTPLTNPKTLPCTFIVSSTLLKQCALLRLIQKAYPDADLIERDFTLPHSPANQADLLLSPSTGLVLTTLQKMKQRPLPGQPDRSAIKEKILILQRQYERLVVLISEGSTAASEKDGARRILDSSDTQALTELEDFCSDMEAEVNVTYVQGGEEAFARSIVVAMARWGLPHSSKDLGDVKLLQDETLWEIFLRRTGFNAFAAQAILSSLKTPYELTSSSGGSASFDFSSPSKPISVFGLPAFILMDPSERIQRFQVLLGGSRILKRINALVDQSWPSAANGFANL